MTVNDIFGLLKKDHRSVSGLLEQLEETSSSSIRTREHVFAELRELLRAHSEAEEECFYERLEVEPGVMELLKHAQKEHDGIDEQLEKMDAMPRLGDEFMGAVRTLKTLVEHHVHEEEHTLFDKARELLTEDDLLEIRDDFEVRRERLLKYAG